MENFINVIKHKLFIMLVILIMIGAGVLLYARYVGTTGLEVKEYTISNINIPETFDNENIIHFTDLHYGRTIKEDELIKLVEQINSYEPVMVVFTGDLIDKDYTLTTEDEEILIKYLSQIESKVGKYMVPGNHDYYFTSYNNIMENSDFINLTNTYDIVYNKSLEPVFISGLDSLLEGSPSLNNIDDYFDSLIVEENISDENEESDKEEIISEDEIEEEIFIPEFRILLIHEPDILTSINYQIYDYDLVLAGHSHNGQVRLPFIGSIVNAVGAETYNEPYYDLGKTDLYISSGIGVSTVNYRLFNKPSINLYRLKKEDSN